MRRLGLGLGLAALAFSGSASATAALSDDELARVDAALLDRSGPMKLRLEAALILGRAGGPGAVPALVEALGDPEFPVRGAATLALGNVGDARAAEGVLRRLQDPESFVRDEAAEAIVHLMQRGHGRALLEQAKRSDAATRARLVTLAGGLEPTQGEPVLALGLADPDEKVRAAAAAGLGNWTPPEAQRFLLASLHAPEASLRASAARLAGERHVTPAVPVLMAMLVSSEESAETVEAARAGLRALSAEVDAGQQQKLAQYGEAEERIQALAVLAAIRDPQAYDLLMAVLDDPELPLRSAAALDLAVLGDKRAAQKLAVMAGREENAPIHRSLETALHLLEP